MDVVISIVVFLVGCAVGYFANRALSDTSKENQRLAAQANQSEAALEQYKQDVAEHLESSANLLDQMNNTCQKAMTQMEQSTKLLQAATPTDVTNMPFFSQETQEQLAKTVALRHNKQDKREEAPLTQAPLDYSGEASGLFADKTQNVTNTEKAD